MIRNFYMPCTMHVDLSINYQRSVDASLYLLKDGIYIRDLSTRPIRELLENSVIASIQEHEFFHHRHSCSTTYGFLCFLISSVGAYHRWCAAVAADEPKQLDTLIDFSSLTPTDLSDPFINAMVGVASTELILELIDKLESKSVNKFIRSDKEMMDFVKLNLPEITPTNDELRTLQDSPTSEDLIETIAIWKQYAWLSHIWYFGKSPHAKVLENTWLHLIEKSNPRYMETANYIMRRAGITLHHSILGIILDLSLNPPFFSKGSFRWTEVSPRLRLEAILDICNELPSTVMNKDCLELITVEEYKDIVNEIERRLGWYKQSLIIKDTLFHINEMLQGLREFNDFPKKGEKEEYEDLFKSRLTYAYTMQFFNGFINRVQYPGYQLFPWHHPDFITTGYIIRPIATQYRDRLKLNPLRFRDGVTTLCVSDPLTMKIVLSDMTENLWLNETFNTNLKQTAKPFARKFYEGIPGALKEHFNYSKNFRKLIRTILDKWTPFEEFISSRLGKDFSTYL